MLIKHNQTRVHTCITISCTTGGGAGNNLEGMDESKGWRGRGGGGGGARRHKEQRKLYDRRT